MTTIKQLILEENIRLVDSVIATNDEAQYFADGAKWAVKKMLELAQKEADDIYYDAIISIDKLKKLAGVE